MSKDSSKTIDLTKITDATAKQPEVKSSSGALSDLNRKISEEALKNPDIGRMLLDRNDQLEKEVKELKTFKEKYHEADKRKEVLTETLKQTECSIGSRNLMLLLGGVMAGFLTSLWNYQYLFWPDFIIGIILIIGGYINFPVIIGIIKKKI